jgi:hypothetical protein
MPTPVSATEIVGEQVQEYLLDLALVGADRAHPPVDRPREGDERRGDVVGSDETQELTLEPKIIARSAAHSLAAFSTSVSKTG